MITVDDAKPVPIEMFEEIEISPAQLGCLRIDVDRKELPVAVAPRLQPRLDVRDLESVARIDVAGQAAAFWTENGGHAEAGLVANWFKKKNQSKDQHLQELVVYRLNIHIQINYSK